jgi:hypothetical protein
VLENGISEKNEAYRDKSSRFIDPLRVRYFRGYIDEVCKAKKAGVKLSHYFAWSFLDNWEWREGFTTDVRLLFCLFLLQGWGEGAFVVGLDCRLCCCMLYHTRTLYTRTHNTPKQ